MHYFEPVLTECGNTYSVKARLASEGGLARFDIKDFFDRVSNVHALDLTLGEIIAVFLDPYGPLRFCVAHNGSFSIWLRIDVSTVTPTWRWETSSVMLIPHWSVAPHVAVEFALDGDYSKRSPSESRRVAASLERLAESMKSAFLAT